METNETMNCRFYSPMQISFAALIGSPVAACWCFARNYKQIGKPATAFKWLLWGGGGSFIAIFILCLLPFSKNLPHYIIPLSYSIGLREVANRIHGDMIKQHISAGGRLVSWWMVAGISLLFLVLVFGILFTGLYFLM